MKKLLLVMFVLGMSISSFAGLKEKNVIGKWKYEAVTDQGSIFGTLTFESKDGKLGGEVNTDDGDTFAFTKVEIRENDVLYFELNTGYETLKGTVTVVKKKFSGTVGNYQGEMPLTGEKLQ
jgi:hypothetical protein